ncbi:MAG: DNA polymerase III subunit beta [Synergistaceae bacterium]|jgi:DNA polymerase-3 subunit beta|nr:DNA polymerase III subunit beta [Synergistaceae bacterium]
MRIEISRPEFLKAWQVAERTSSTKSTISSLAGVLVTVEGDKVVLSATDLRTSVSCVAGGVRASQDGSAVFPVKLLGELFKKAPADTFSVEIKQEKGVFTAGRNKTRFMTWPVDEFPRLPKSEGAERLCDVSAFEFARILTEGSVASSPTDDFPKYLGACLLQLKEKALQVISTDGHRLSLSRCFCEEEGEMDLLLPVAPLRELQRLLGAFANVRPGGTDTLVRILYDGSMVWFQMGGIEFSIRRVESSFPNYEKILNPNSTTTALVKRADLLSVLERIDIVVRSHTRLVILQLSPGGNIRFSGKAPEMGTTVEELEANIDGESLKAGFNVGFLQDGLKSLNSENVKMNLNGEAGQMILRHENTDDFLYMLMPVRIAPQDLIDEEEEEEDFKEDLKEESDQAIEALDALKELKKTSED